MLRVDRAEAGRLVSPRFDICACVWVVILVTLLVLETWVFVGTVRDFDGFTADLLGLTAARVAQDLVAGFLLDLMMVDVVRVLVCFKDLFFGLANDFSVGRDLFLDKRPDLRRDCVVSGSCSDFSADAFIRSFTSFAAFPQVSTDLSSTSAFVSTISSSSSSSSLPSAWRGSDRGSFTDSLLLPAGFALVIETSCLSSVRRSKDFWQLGCSKMF
mmetsp:Transcript_1622/g.3772  ORF Transcript_1622/g.3772 Transcript_1622/m.3772 type:complete len:214 (+) Transcript_1622:799-1440(+)